MPFIVYSIHIGQSNCVCRVRGRGGREKCLRRIIILIAESITCSFKRDLHYAIDVNQCGRRNIGTAELNPITITKRHNNYDNTNIAVALTVPSKTVQLSIIYRFTHVLCIGEPVAVSTYV